MDKHVVDHFVIIIFLNRILYKPLFWEEISLNKSVHDIVSFDLKNKPNQTTELRFRKFLK